MRKACLHPMIYSQLMTLMSQGETAEAIRLLLEFVREHDTRLATDVYLVSNRFNRVSNENDKGLLEHSDFQIEMNSIAKSLLDIIQSIEGVHEVSFRKKRSPEEVMATIIELEQRFHQTRKKSQTIQSNQTRLREKNNITSELGDLFINHPELILMYYGTHSECIIAGIANRYKKLPELEGIDFFESVLETDMGNFTKCCIANALVEIIYTGQIQVQEDHKSIPHNKRIANILDRLFPNSFQTVKLSITPVSAELDYFTADLLWKG